MHLFNSSGPGVVYARATAGDILQWLSRFRNRRPFECIIHTRTDAKRCGRKRRDISEDSSWHTVCCTCTNAKNNEIQRFFCTREFNLTAGRYSPRILHDAWFTVRARKFPSASGFSHYARFLPFLEKRRLFFHPKVQQWFLISGWSKFNQTGWLIWLRAKPPKISIY